VEFKDPEDIAADYPNGVREMSDGGTFGILAGQPTDDSEMALTLARTLVRDGAYVRQNARDAYVAWHNSGPFDIGHATTMALGMRKPIPTTEANGAMMRVSPLGIWCAGRYDIYKEEDFAEIARLAREDAAITHPTKVCGDANVLYVAAIAGAVRHGFPTRREMYDAILGWCEKIDAAESLRTAVRDAEKEPPLRHIERYKGWVLVAFQNALFQLLHAENFEEALVTTIGYGHDTDTNAAICGALLGAAMGFEAIPKRWREAIAACRPSKDNPRARHPRPEIYWPCDAEELAGKLLGR
jgi:ADP-ribosylglycohydrolase